MSRALEMSAILLTTLVVMKNEERGRPERAMAAPSSASLLYSSAPSRCRKPNKKISVSDTETSWLNWKCCNWGMYFAYLI